MQFARKLFDSKLINDDNNDEDHNNNNNDNNNNNNNNNSRGVLINSKLIGKSG